MTGRGGGGHIACVVVDGADDADNNADAEDDEMGEVALLDSGPAFP